MFLSLDIFQTRMVNRCFELDIPINIIQEIKYNILDGGWVTVSTPSGTSNKFLYRRNIVLETDNINKIYSDLEKFKLERHAKYSNLATKFFRKEFAWVQSCRVFETADSYILEILAKSSNIYPLHHLPKSSTLEQVKHAIIGNSTLLPFTDKWLGEQNVLK